MSRITQHKTCVIYGLDVTDYHTSLIMPALYTTIESLTKTNSSNLCLFLCYLKSNSSNCSRVSVSAVYFSAI